MKTRVRWTLFAAAVLGTAAAIVASRYVRTARSDRHREVSREVETDAGAQVRAVTMMPLNAESRPDVFRSLAASTDADGTLHARAAGGAEYFVNPGPPAMRLSDESKKQIVEEASDFIYYRFCQNDPVVYREWRKAKGYRMRSLADIKATLTDSYDQWCGKPIAGDATPESVFDDIWRAEPRHESRRGCGVTKIAGDASGIAIAAASVEAGNHAASAAWLSTPTVQAEGWYSTITSNAMAFFERPFLATRQRGPAIAPAGESAVVGCIVECESGDRGAMRLTFYRLPGAAWRLEGLSYSFSPPATIPPVTY